LPTSACNEEPKILIHTNHIEHHRGVYKKYYRFYKTVFCPAVISLCFLVVVDILRLQQIMQDPSMSMMLGKKFQFPTLPCPYSNSIIYRHVPSTQGHTPKGISVLLKMQSTYNKN
jgi:hypothetical protein